MKKELRIKKTVTRCALIKDIVYSQVPAFFGNTTRPLTLSLIRPALLDGSRPPLIIWINGGAWLMLDKDFNIPELSYLAHRGFAIASIEYRLSNEAVFPAQLHDVKTAIRFLRAHADTYKINAGKIGVMGESAGGYLAAMAGACGNRKEFDTDEWKDFSSEVQAVVDWYGPTDLSRIGEDPEDSDHNSAASPESLLIGAPVLENPDLCEKANPIHYLSRDTPPFLIFHGDSDTTVPLSQSEILYDALIKNGSKADFYVLNEAEHAGDEFFQPEIKKLICEFFTKHLQR